MEEVKSAYRDFGSALKKTDEINLTVTGRISGRKTTRPVWFVEERNKVYLLPVSGSDSEWYKNVLKQPTVTLSTEEAAYTAKARPITDPAKVREIVDKFRAKYGAGEVEKYYSKFDVAVEVPLGED
jgi:deazaflavin-dependent oxidoreductase (nitroreductase family)